MADLPREIRQARVALRGVRPSPGARERIYASLVAPPRPARRKLLAPALVTAAVLVASGAAAVSLGFVQLPAPFRAVQDVSEPRPSETRPVRRTVRPSSTRKEAPGPKTEVPAASAAPIPPSAAFSDQEPAGAQARQARALDLAGTTSPSSPPPPASELAQQVKAYRRAVALIPDQPARALMELRQFRQQWPGSTLSHEVDVRIVQTLLMLGRKADAQREAAAFMVRHPGSARTAEMRAVADSNPSDGGSNRSPFSVRVTGDHGSPTGTHED